MERMPNMASSPLRPSSPDALAGLPKDSPRGPPTPPPAYFPRQPVVAMNPYLSARFAGNYAAAMLPPQHAVDAADLGLNLNAGWHDVDDYDDDDDGSGSSSAITLRINTAVRITGDKNIMCIPTSPADNARFVAEAVMRAIRQGVAEEQGGLPMIDEEGRPRPLRIGIEAGVEVNGVGNVLGGEEVVLGALLGKRRRAGEGEGEREERDGLRRRRRRTRSASV